MQFYNPNLLQLLNNQTQQQPDLNSLLGNQSQSQNGSALDINTLAAIIKLLQTNSNGGNSGLNLNSLTAPNNNGQSGGSSMSSMQNVSSKEEMDALKKRMDKIQRVVLVESKEIKTLKQKNVTLQHQLDTVNEN